MNLKLIKMNEIYKEQLNNMMEEWYAAGEKIVPYAIVKTDYHDFTNYVINLESPTGIAGFVPTSTFFCLDIDRNILDGGHIGDGVRPSERRKGIATKMISLALEDCKKLGIHKVLMVCDKKNIGSAKSIINNGGVLENEIIVNGIVEQRYWIEN